MLKSPQTEIRLNRSGNWETAALVAAADDDTEDDTKNPVAFSSKLTRAATSADDDDAGPRHTRYYTLTQLISTSRTKEFKNTTNNGNP